MQASTSGWTVKKLDTTGTLKDVTRDLRTGKLAVTFLVDRAGEADITLLASLPVIDITARQHREKRSLNANAYFHKLCTLIAESIDASLIEVKNRLIREYGQYEYVDGMIPTYLVKEEYVEAMQAKEGVHFTLLGFETIDGIVYGKMAAMRGSHTYDTKEMSRLIDGTVREAKELGIETLTPDELERMISAWGR